MSQERFRKTAERMASKTFPFHSHRGFTLIELMMVIVVIGILTSLIVVASMSVLGTSREAATKATLMKIEMLLEERRNALNRHVDKKISQQPNLSPDGKIRLRKEETRKYFPQTWDEAKDLLAEYKIPRPYPQTPPASDPDSATESSEVLHFFLMLTAIPGEQTLSADAFLTSEIATTGAGPGDIFPDGIKRRPYFVDSWGKPLRYYRWPTRLVRPEGYNYNYDMSQLDKFVAPVAPAPEQLTVARVLNPTLANGIVTRPELPPDIIRKQMFDTDEDDPIALLGPGEPADPTDASQLNAWIASVQQFENIYHTYGTNHQMLLISSGPDGEFGLFSPNSVRFDDPAFKPGENGRLCMPVPGESGKIYDNLTNLNTKGGVK